MVPGQWQLRAEIAVGESIFGWIAVAPVGCVPRLVVQPKNDFHLGFPFLDSLTRLWWVGVESKAVW